MGSKGYNDPLITARRLLNLDRVEKWFARAFTKELRPAAVAVTINSPGGSAAQAELIYTLIRRLSKQTGIPVFTFAEDVAASGGYWLMCAGDKAYALDASLVGSIGVISATFGAVETAHRLGLERRIYTAGEAKVQLDPFLNVTPEQEARLKDLMDDLHASFKDRVREARGDRLAAGRDDELFSGRAWTGRQALKLGLLDGLGEMRGVMQHEYGDKARFLLCSETPQPRFTDLFGLGSLLRSSGAGGSSAAAAEGWGSGGSSNQGLLERLTVGAAGEEAYYAAARSAIEAAMDEAEQRALWARFKVS
ncbi:hypothetical protein COHA_003053 [Chlorella ohadii]|uniref:Peptidase S49 domain-containing protein n=1 Tax=Chlorella ohadii TaxID=2649997 RepID=A0AAD5DTH3_9CHLO|nr:hypothetical protein COHA_003053 [Chlorella ohadii]